MMLPKEVRNILEGVHYFLLEDLKNETLSGKVECMRRGLLLQLEALKELFPLEFSTKFDPNANIRNGTSLSLPYLNSDQLIVNGSGRMSTSSSGSANYSTGYSNESSIGYSGDGVVSSHSQNGGSDNAHSDFSSENYEDFDDVNKVLAAPTITTEAPKKRPSSELHRQDSRASSGYDEKEDHDDDCFIDVDPIPFRFLIAKCDYHSGLLKRSKGLLKSHKSFLGVLTGPHLYLYQKETDDHQRKVIDLTGYEVRDCKSELKSRTKNRDFSFELIRPGRKTHTFYSANRKDREFWIEHLRRATMTTKTGFQISVRFPLTKVDEMSHRQNQDVEDAEEAKEEGDQEDHEGDADEEIIYDDFYEELNIETESRECQKTSVSTASSSATYDGVKNDLSYYYTVPDDVAPKQTLDTFEKSKRSPPERPPLPKVLIAQRPPAVRPLPEAPEEISFNGDDSTDDIYCEIEGDESFESSNLLMCTHSLSQEIFDTISQRVTPLPEINHPKRYPQNLSEEREEESEFESYDVPSDVSIFSVPPNRKTTYRMPSLPPKGIPTTHIDDDDDDSEYKVPTFSIFPDNIYNVPPSNPVAVIQEAASQMKQENDNVFPLNFNSKHEKSAFQNDESVVQNDKCISELDPGNHGNNHDNKNNNEAIKEIKLNCQSETKGNCDSTRLSEAESEINSAEKTKKDLKQLDIGTSSSVKDLIAKLNQNEEQRESFSSKSYGSFKHKIYEPNKTFKNQKESSTETIGSGSGCAAEKVRAEIKIQDDFVDPDFGKSNQNENNSFRLPKIKNFIENKSEVSENLKNKFTNFIEKNFPLVSPDLKTEYSQLATTIEDTPNDKLNVYIAKFAFVSIDPETLSFSRGDEIIVTETKDETRWWKGITKGREGLVPKEYLRKKQDTQSIVRIDSNA